MKKFGIYAIIAISSFLLCCNAGHGTDASLLRIDSPCGWTERLETAQGSTFYLVVLPGKEGEATLYHSYPNGSIQEASYFLLGYDRLPMYADALGRHVFSYTIEGRESNSVTVDVNPARQPVPPVPRCSAPACPAPEPMVKCKPVITPARPEPVSLSGRLYDDAVMLHYYPIGSHVMSYQRGIVAPKYSSQYHFGRDFSLGTIDSNYPGTPFILQYLSDP